MATINNSNDLINAINAIKGCKIAHIEYTSDERLPKYLGLGNVVKHVSGEVQINYSYENAVNNRLSAQGSDPTFESGDLPFGKWLISNKIIEHKGTLYLRYYNYVGQRMTTEYVIDGRPATESELNAIIDYKKSNKKKSNTQSEKGLTSNQVEPRNIKISSITALKCGELDYRYAVAQAM